MMLLIACSCHASSRSAKRCLRVSSRSAASWRSCTALDSSESSASTRILSWDSVEAESCPRRAKGEDGPNMQLYDDYSLTIQYIDSISSLINFRWCISSTRLGHIHPKEDFCIWNGPLINKQ